MVEEAGKLRCETNIGKKFQISFSQAFQDQFAIIEFSSVLSISSTLDPRLKKLNFSSDLCASQTVRRIDNMIKSKLLNTDNVTA